MVYWSEHYTGRPWEVSRRGVSIAGVVSDALSHTPIAGALVEIVAGPAVFDALLDSVAANPARRFSREGFVCQRSRADGRYYVLDLPDGAYDLRVSAPLPSSRYGTLIVRNIHVTAPRTLDESRTPALVNVALSPTRIRGRVTRDDNARPVAGAKVRLRGDLQAALTDDDGQYLLSGLVAGEPTIEVTAKNLVTTTRKISLSAGQEQTVDVVLART